jgi:hypothetical protein
MMELLQDFYAIAMEQVLATVTAQDHVDLLASCKYGSRRSGCET